MSLCVAERTVRFQAFLSFFLLLRSLQDAIRVRLGSLVSDIGTMEQYNQQLLRFNVCMFD